MGRMGGAPPLPSVLFVFAFCLCYRWCSLAQAPIPSRYDGFVYEVGAAVRGDSIVVEAFFDPLCPDSRDAWPPLKRLLHECSPRVFFVVHPFPLPYHDNSFFSCRALHIANKLNASTTYPLMELFFKYQEKYYNKPTRGMSRESVMGHIIDLAVEAVGNSSIAAFEKGFEDSKTDRATRTSFNYGCSRGVIGTPFFFVNGFPLPGAGSALNYDQWRAIIDPLLLEHNEVGEEAVQAYI
uniref:Serine protease inhibitor 3/4 n=1 Tax=Anthurium amnicola TaxID=1678845 RepID=A0A1D1Y109_9ARAE